MKKMLFITPELPYPAQSGGKVKSLKLLHSLAERYDITLASPLKLEDAKHVENFHAISPCRNHLHENVSIARTPLNLLKSYSKNIPLNVLRSSNKALTEKIYASGKDFDVVFLDHYEVYQYIPEDFKGVTVYHAHNAYFKMWKRYAQLPGNPAMRAAAWLESKRVKHCETQVAKASDITFAAPNDAKELTQNGVNARHVYITYHLGDDSQLDLPDLCFSDSKEKLMYVGYLGWEPNSQGLLWFIEEVWPIVKAKHPNVTFDIVGKGADEKLAAAVASQQGIALKGFVEDLQQVYRQSRVSVAPLLFGSGMKVKVLDALAAGLPTVTTEVGAEGIAIEKDKHLLVADQPAEMAEQIHRLLTDKVLWERLQKHSRQLIAERYTWAKLFEQMHASLEEALRRKQDSQIFQVEHPAHVS